MRFLLINLSLFFLLLSHAYGESRNFKINLGVGASSKNIFRGAVFYPSPSIFLGPSFVLFEKISIRGPNISLGFGERDSTFKFEIGGRLVSDGEPLIPLDSDFDEDSDYRASRSSTFETYINYAYRFGFRNLFEFGGSIARDLIRHDGQYFSFHFKLPLYKFLSLKLTGGLGSSSHNKYIYGVGAKSGFGHRDISLNYVIPKLPWDGIIIFGVTQSEVLQNDNKSAFLVRGNDKQLSGRTTWIWFF